MLVWMVRMYACVFQGRTSLERRQEQEETTPSTEVSSPPTPPPSLPARPEEADGSCDCESTDPVTKPSAWEQASSSIRNGDENSGTDSGGGGVVGRVSVSPAGPLDLRIFCGTWNVAGLICAYCLHCSHVHLSPSSKAKRSRSHNLRILYAGFGSRASIKVPSVAVELAPIFV